jgi:hypothetical protein
MKKFHVPILIPLLIMWMVITTFAQAPDLSRDFVLEVKSMEGRPISHQKLTDWKWFGAFAWVEGWKPKPGELPINAVKVFALQRPGVTTVRIKLLRGTNLEVEELVGDYVVSEKPTVINELANFGIVPFEMRLIRAPTVVSDLPSIKNHTRSLVVSVEPVSSVLPSFNVRVLNSSDRPVTAISYHTSIDGRPKFIGVMMDEAGGILIPEGEVYQRKLPYPTKLVNESTGDVPDAQKGLQLNILAVVFTDGSYEGEPVNALHLKGYKTGEKIQLTRIVTLLRSSAAADVDLLGQKVDELSYKIALSDIKDLAAEFPEMPDAELEYARSAAEVSALDIQKSFRANLGRSASLPANGVANAVKAAIAKCEALLAAIP